jgi:serine/threonine protein kinase
MSKAKRKAEVQPVPIPEHLRDKVNPVKTRILFLSPSVLSGEERECRKDDFESLTNSNIGVGGFGKVYKVRHKVSRNVFAIKVINKKKILEHDLVEQIKLEVKIMYKLDHDHILRLYNHYEDDDNFYLILQYCAKGQIYSLLKREGRFSEKVAAQYLRECIAAVQYLNSLDPPIIHRDIKPENILLDSSGQVKLADFGWSNYFDEDARLTYCGTPEYLAPEMIKQSGHDKTLDVWNLGVLLFELLTGSPPFEGKSQAELFKNILELNVKWPKSFSAIAKDLIQKLLKIEPSQRLPVEQILEHPWFQSIPPLRPVNFASPPDKASSRILEQALEKKDYQIVSKPSVMNQAEQEAETSRQSALDRKLKKAKLSSQQQSASLDLAKQESARVQELVAKNQELKREVQSLNFELQKKNSEWEQQLKRVQELEAHLAEIQKYSSGKGSPEAQVKQLQEEVQKLRS